MANTYNLASTDPEIKAISRVRKHIPDRESPWFFSDAEILDFLDENSDVVKLAAADALESKATDEAFVQKVQSTLGVTTDGAKTADFVLQRATALRAQVTTAQAAAKVGAGSFSTAAYYTEETA